MQVLVEFNWRVAYRLEGENGWRYECSRLFQQDVPADGLKKVGILLTFARSRMGAIDQGLGHQEVDACTRGMPAASNGSDIGKNGNKSCSTK